MCDKSADDKILECIEELAVSIYAKAREDVLGELAVQPKNLITTDAPSLPDDFHLGYSRISSYQECPRKYYYSYIEGIRTPGSTAMRRGTAYHEVVEELLKYKMGHKGKLLNGDKADQLAVKAGKAQELSESEIYRVIDATRFYHNALYPLHKPLAIEESFETVRGGVALTGRIDLIDEEGWVIDHKFSYDTWSDARAKSGCQPMVYQWAALDAYEKKFPGWEFKGFQYNIIKLFPVPKIQRITVPKLSEAASAWWENEVRIIALGIAKGHFPATASEDHCKWCGHKELCGPVMYDIETEMLVDKSTWDDEEDQ